MRIAILANTARSFVRPMAEGLRRMLDTIGVESRVFYYGVPMLNQSYCAEEFMGYYRPRAWKNVIKRTVLYPYILQFKAYDVIVVVQAKPDVFLKSFRTEAMRAVFPDKPIVLYDLDYCPRNIDMWNTFAFRRDRHHGLEKYDWYLCASDVWEAPMPAGRQPYSRIGLDILDGTLFPERNDEFIALVDFEREKTRAERALQLSALEKTQTPYIVLQGSYSMKKIREIYRRCSVYFPAFKEAFGLPICELQACGSYVLTPYPDWCYAHGLKDDLGKAGLGRLSSNFIVYENDRDRLILELDRIRGEYDPEPVVDTFEAWHPHFVRGDLEQLQDFVQKVDSREINGTSHEAYREPDRED